jgi:Ca2+-transporting ATPase
LVKILLISACVSFVISYLSPRDEHSIPAWIEPLVIFTILVLNAIVGLWQDYDAENALEALSKL